MDRRIAAQSEDAPASDAGEPEAIEFVRFCYRRRRVGWPELYDEMCAVAGRGLYRGYSVDDLNGIGVGLTLFEMPAMAAIVQRVVAEDQERRRRSVHAIRAAHADRADVAGVAAAAEDAITAMELPGEGVVGTEVMTQERGPEPQPRLVPIAAGA
jgi:hypothetical protein